MVRIGFFEQAVRGFGLAVAVLTVAIVIAVQVVPDFWPPNGLSRAEYAFCAHDDAHADPEFVETVVVPNLRRHLPEFTVPWGYANPQWAAACRYVYAIAGVSREQEAWCADASKRPTLAAAVAVLGNGLYGDAIPQRDSARYVQACRLAYDYMRAPAAAPITADSAAFALTPAEDSFCSDVDPGKLHDLLAKIGLEASPPVTPIEASASRAAGCRLAFIGFNFDRGGQ
jgi:hypothetical protein